MWILQLLGPHALLRREVGEPLRLGRKSQVLLAYLACSPAGRASRSAITRLLWPDQDEDEARNALRQCLHQLRRTAGESGLVASEGDRLVLASEMCAVDIREFQRLSTQSSRDALVLSARLYQGSFAEGLEIGGEAGRWLAAERQRWRDVAHHVVERISEVASKDEPEAFELARRLLLEDPLHEGAYRSLMRLYERAGVRGKALQLWDDCRRVLRLELGVEPSAATREFAARLKAGAAAVVIPGGVPLTQQARPPIGASIPDHRIPAHDHLLRGWQLFTLGSAEENRAARLAFEAASGASPDHPEAATLVGWTYFADFLFGWCDSPADSFQHARAVAERVGARFAGHAAPRALQGKLLLWSKQYDEAAAVLEEVLASLPASPYAHSNFAEALIACGRYEDALKLARRAVVMDPNDRGIFLTVEGQALYCIGELEAASAKFQSAITRNPLYCVAHAMRSAALAELGDLSAAKAAALAARANNRRYSIDFALNAVPLRDQLVRDRLVACWRKACMPEQEEVATIQTSP